MAENAFGILIVTGLSLQSSVAATDLISFLKALLDCRMRRGIRFPQWWMLLVGLHS